MALMLGIDTGGTYTDAVLLEDDRVVAKAKALTTRHDLAVGVGKALDEVLRPETAMAGQIGMVSLSTTLATNALVEGQGGRIALVFIGFTESDLSRQGLRAALKGDPVLFLSGGHSHAGVEAAPLDTGALRQWIAEHGNGVSGFAVASAFATRNPAHELAAQAIIAEESGKPVSCSHHLSSKLNGPKRAMTAVFNARLIGMIDHLISATEGLMARRGIPAPLMVVRGDGALISAAMARQKPIETILSGPAASLVGARWLTGISDALVSDIGGTTTDIALLRDGRPMIDPEGASVGGFRTMVEAVAMRTTGLGGDSEVHLTEEGMRPGLRLGPRRVIPVSLLARDWGELVHGTLDRQLSAPVTFETDGRFIVPVRRDVSARAGLSPREEGLIDRIGDVPRALSGLLTARTENAALQRLIERGIVAVSAVTPSDASHVLGGMETWDGKAAVKALRLFARKRGAMGDPVAPDARILAQAIVDQLRVQTASALLEAAFEEDPAFSGAAAHLATHELTRRGLEGHSGLVAIEARIGVPIVGLGASAHAYYPELEARLRTEVTMPEHAEVANAIGAVVGQISIRRSATITQPEPGIFRAHLPESVRDFSAEDVALSAVEALLGETAEAAARAAGADDLHRDTACDIRRSPVEGADTFLEAALHVTVTGRPRLATR